MSRFSVTDTPLAGLKCITRQRLGDPRGFLARMFCAEELAVAGWHKPIAQINLTHTAQRGAIRGMHFQWPPHAEMKLVSCIRGEVWDVAVDLRLNSKTYLHWHAETLSAENGRAFLIPEGFGHGFQTLAMDCEMLYLHSAAYERAAEAGLRHDDPRLNITWPLAPTDCSERDRAQPLLTDQFRGIDV